MNQKDLIHQNCLVELQQMDQQCWGWLSQIFETWFLIAQPDQGQQKSQMLVDLQKEQQVEKQIDQPLSAQ